MIVTEKRCLGRDLHNSSQGLAYGYRDRGCFAGQAYYPDALRMCLMRLGLALIGCVLLASRVALAADPQPYTVHFNSTGDRALNATVRAVSQLQALRKTVPVGPFALVDRAEQDIPRLRQGPLESVGYYRSSISITINGRPLSDPDLADILLALPKKKSARVEVHIDTGPLYHLRKVTVEGAVSQNALKAFGLKSGAPAVAADVQAAQERLLTALQAEGHAYATVGDAIAYLDARLPVLDVTLKANPGPTYMLGAIQFEGLMRVNEAFLRRQLLIHPGEPYNATEVDRARTTLLALGVFASVTVRLPPQSTARDERLPVTFVVVERKRQTVALAPEYSSDLGIVAQTSWTDRNLFGNAEQLTVSSNLYGVGGNGLATNGVSYDVLGQLLKPDFLHTDQSLQFSLQLLRQQLEAYDQIAAIGGVALTRKLSSVWQVSIGSTLEEEKIQQNEVIDCTAVWVPEISPTTGKEVAPPPATGCHYTLLGLPISAHYDSTDLTNPLNDPLHGMRVSLDVTPTESLFGRHTHFFVTQATGSVYFDFTHLGWSDPGDSVLALRALAGQARGTGQFTLPPDQRLYAGGTATVRGYVYQSVGPYFPLPETPGEYPEGGTGIAAGTAELRQRLIGNFGMAAFVDAAEVSASADPFGGTYSVGYGTGVRYYTPIGPIRLDVAFPLKRLPDGDSFEAYIGLGQAF